MTSWRRLNLSTKYDIWCIVDAEDYDWIIATQWNYGWHTRSPERYYAKRNVGDERSTIYLHREIAIRMQPDADLSLHVDHFNGQSLDNRRANLRWVTRSENSRNVVKYPPSLESIIAQLEEPAEVPF